MWIPLCRTTLGGKVPGVVFGEGELQPRNYPARFAAGTRKCIVKRMKHMQIVAGTLLGAILLVGVCAYMQPMTSECPTAHPGIICPMHGTGAPSFWQQAMVLSRRVTELAVVVLVLLLGFGVVTEWRRRGDPHSLYYRFHALQPPLSYLQELFSQGILHPKIY